MKIFSEVFTLVEIDPNGKIFDEVSRGVFEAETCKMYLDYHTNLLKCKKIDKMEITMFSNDNKFGEEDIPEKYRYLMGNGILYKKEEKDNTCVLTFSFSGLLMQLVQKKSKIKNIDEHQRFFLGVAMV